MTLEAVTPVQQFSSPRLDMIKGVAGAFALLIFALGLPALCAYCMKGLPPLAPLAVAEGAGVLLGVAGTVWYVRRPLPIETEDIESSD